MAKIGFGPEICTIAFLVDHGQAVTVEQTGSAHRNARCREWINRAAAR
jgi:hypothetical protein